MAEPVTVDTFVRAETNRMLATLQAEAGGVNRLRHERAPTPIDRQPVVRMNRDTLYSSAVVDVAQGAVLTVPEHGERYVSAMVVNQDHFVERLIHDAGEHEMSADELGTPWVGVALRILVDPRDPADVAAVNELQDDFALRAASARPLDVPEVDGASLDALRAALKEVARHLGTFDRAFGPRGAVDPVRHLLGTAAGWGGLPDTEARYLGVEPHLPVGAYRLTVRDVPVDGFWSISVYNADGYFERNDREAYSVNDVTAERDADGAVTVHFGGDGDRPNCLPIVDGWNYTVRLYRPRAEILDGSWAFPALEPA